MRSLLFSLAVALANGAVAAPQARIELLPEVGIAGETAKLGQVARLQSESLDLMRALVNLPIGRVPPAGSVSRIRRAAVSEWLRRQPSLRGAQFDWKGPEETTLTRAATRVPGEQIAQSAAESVQASLARSGRRGEVTAAAIPRDVYLPPGDIRLDTLRPQAVHLRRRMLVWVDLWSGELRIRTVPVTLEVLLADETASDQASTDRALPAFASEPAHAVRSAREVAPAVVRGQWASLRSVTGAVVLESRVEVLQDGRLGERVRVRQQGATAGVHARVLAGGILELAP